MDADIPPRTVTKFEDAPKVRQSISGEADFETAITAAGFGKFNYLLCLCLIPSTWSQVFEASTLAYVLPVAECDLNLTLQQKGLLNGACFAGMILSGFFWGYLSDMLGRRKIMVYGYLMDWCCMVTAAFSQNFAMLMAAKFMGGFILMGFPSTNVKFFDTFKYPLVITGIIGHQSIPSGFNLDDVSDFVEYFELNEFRKIEAAASLLSEFHSSSHRSRVQLIRGIIMALAQVTIPLLSWTILPRNLNFSIFGIIEIHSWNIFLLVCSFVPLTGGISFIFMPESPMFLMSKGRNEEAMDVFRRVYSMNYNKPKDQYPIKSLENRCRPSGSTLAFRRASIHIIRGFVGTVKPLFTRQYVFKLLLACTNIFMLFMSANTLKLWLPQLLQATNDYQQSHGTSSHICDMLESLIPTNDTKEVCEVNLNNSSVYINSTILGISQVAVYALVAVVIERLSEKMCFGILATISAIASLAIYASQNMPTLMTLFAMSLSTSGVCGNIATTLTLELFPTSVRTSALSLNLMCSRLGSLIGSSVFPLLLSSGCLPPFLFFGLLTFGSAITVFLFPNTKGKMLE